MQNTISFKSKFGWISATEINNKISRIHFLKETRKGKLSKNLIQLRINLNNYFKSKKEQFKIPIRISGNKIQRKIWGELKKIRNGKTRTYGEIAKKLRISPRYVGKVCGENMHVILIPCHRVIRSDGKIGGFSAKGGTTLKKKLLDLEARSSK
jgi:methylated-DNA-[protein]-cysteine S-methyltransferase|tara:strand:+ start:79 stop:537 length:459 start_codon:yes stop_codon:yes gene_type:complete